MKIQNCLRSITVTGILLGASGVSLPAGQGPMTAKEELQRSAPTVRVVTPAGPFGSYMLPANAARLLVVLEITDVTNAGIALNSSGRPEFLEPDQNVRVFLDHVTQQSTYTNGHSQMVIQLVSDVPLADLVRHPSKRITPLVDWNSVPPDAKASGIRIPKENHVEQAVFRFRVKDTKGNVSPFPTVADGQELDFSFAIAFQDALYVYKPVNSPN